MKKVAIITMNGFTNYGNRLQNIALSRLLEDKGFQVINGLSYYTKSEWINSSNSFVKKAIKLFTPFYIFKRRYLRLKNIPDGINGKRYISFMDYYNQYYSISDSIVCRNDNEAKKRLEQKGIDYYVVGSDQVWNPYFECNNYELLTAVPNEKKYSFAASFGVVQIDEVTKKRIKDKLRCFRYLSVREQSAVNLVNSITGRTADLTLDPTLLLSKEEWQKYIQIPTRICPAKYICSYFLGELPSEMQEFAKKENLKIISLNDVRFPEFYIINPGEFLYYLKNAEYVFTDSFHAVAFSVKFHKKFYVFDRKQTGVVDMFTRIESLLGALHLSNHIYCGENTSEGKEENWNEIDNILDRARKTAMDRIIDSGMEP